VYNVVVNGEDVASTTADYTSSFTAVPDRDGVARIDIYYIWAGGPKKVAKKDVGQPECVVLSFDGDGGEPSPLKAEKVEIVKGLSGGAAHFGRDSVLEYKADMPGFLTPTSGTFRTWIRQDDTMAVAWLQAAEQENDRAQVALARHELNAGDRDSAERWLRKAAKRDNPTAKKLLAELFPGKEAVEKEDASVQAAETGAIIEHLQAALKTGGDFLEFVDELLSDAADAVSHPLMFTIKGIRRIVKVIGKT
jgi:hypothetical protein